MCQELRPKYPKSRLLLSSVPATQLVPIELGSGVKGYSKGGERGEKRMCAAKRVMPARAKGRAGEQEARRERLHNLLLRKKVEIHTN